MLKGEDEEAMIKRLGTEEPSDSLWTFGFGSNMNVRLLGTKKGLTVLEHAPATVRGWRLSFALKAMALVEPSFADAQRGSEESEIHGVAVRMSHGDYAKLSKQERSYIDEKVQINTYDGRVLTGRLYTKPNPEGSDDIPCSKRYLNVLVQGAQDAGLDPSYIERLSQRPTYSAGPETLAKRRAMLPAPETLAPITVEELCAGYAPAPRGNAAADAEMGRTAILGYVLELPRSKVVFASHLGRDLTARQSRQWRGISLDEDDDFGKPPFPIVAATPADELEFVHHWIDHYLDKGAAVVGFLAEFRADQLAKDALRTSETAGIFSLN